MSELPVWYFPSHEGDFRLVKRGDGCTLVVEKATMAEQLMLAKFAKKIGLYTGDPLPGTSVDYFADDREIPIDRPIAGVGKILLKLARSKKATLTAVVSANGKVTVSEDTEAGVDALVKADTKAAVSVTRPTPCCPQCIPGAVTRASEVLLSFLTPAQHETWSRSRFVIAVGGLSGHRYLLAHRNSPRAVKQSKICFDLDDNDILHFHDWSVPAEEEVLAAKLILEHREPWLRNEATALGFGRRRLQFKNPFGGFMDGTQDAAFTREIGELLQGKF